MARHRDAWAERIERLHAERGAAALRAPLVAADAHEPLRGLQPAAQEVEPDVVLLLPYPMSVNEAWRQTKDGRRVLTEKARLYKADTRMRAIRAGFGQPADGPVCVRCTLHPKLPADAPAREARDGPLWHLALRTLDVDNPLKLMLDALSGVAWHDDRQLVEVSSRRGEPIEGGSFVVTVRRGVWW